MTTFRLLSTVAGASLRCVASRGWERSSVFGGCLLRSFAVTPPTVVAAVSFHNEIGGTGCPDESGGRARVNVEAKENGNLGLESAPGTGVVGGGLRCPGRFPRRGRGSFGAKPRRPICRYGHLL
uniref:Putative secreted protein n=1 Tax=Ixodes ricinus TaxID=34613 RepID=A0A6B0UPD1_IXORI